MKLNSFIQKISDTVRHAGRKPESAAPPRLSNPARIPYGPFRFKFQLPKGTAYAIEASNDVRNWSPISTDTSNGETIEYVDSEAFKFSYRFYRLLSGAVRSVNVIGYASMTVPPGFSMIANPFETRETVSDLFKGWPDGTSFSKFDTHLFRLVENCAQFGKWTHATDKFAPGEGAIFFNPTSDYKSLSFAGEVMQGRMSVPIPAGFSIHSSLVPQAGNLEDLGFPISDGDVIHLFDRDQQKCVEYPREEGKWAAGPPVVSVGESFWVAKTKPGNWTQSLLVEDSTAG
jgi:hypothetical protein